MERTTTTSTTVYVPTQSCKHASRTLTKLLLEKTVRSETSDVYLSDSTLTTSDVYLTPNATLAEPPDVIPRHMLPSPPSEEYKTPECTADPSFAMPTYFDKKRKAAAVIVSAVRPLTNFQVLKQKSLTTIPAVIEKHRKTEELFTNFPFLTPLAHRKNSLVADANRLSGCIEDEFYCIPSEAEAECGSLERIDVRHRFRSLSNRALGEALTSTPKGELERHSYNECPR